MTRLAEGLGPVAHQALDVILEKLSFEELVALAFDWENTWARPTQLAPKTWRSLGFLCGRGYGKTRSCAEIVNAKVRVASVGLAAQTEDKSIEIHIEGPTGIIHTAPPWFRPKWEASKKELVWPNGARAYVRTPEKPGTIRSGEHELSWLSELQSWPKATSTEAILNFEFATRAGDAQILWDATTKRGNLILKALRAASLAEPTKHVIVRGRMRDNLENLGAGVVEDLERKYKGTRSGREELDGEDLDDAENTIAEQEWIDGNRRPMPPSFVRRGLGIDPAVTSRTGSDRTGIVAAGLEADGHALVLRDLSGKYAPHVWATLVLDYYVDNRCDIIVVETNKGGDLLTSNLRAAAAARKPKVTVVVLGEDEKPQHVAGVVYVREVHSRGEKADRARPLATAYEAKRVSHVIGEDFTSLEETLTTWEPTPGARSPDDLDALTHIVGELLGLTDDTPDPAAGFAGLSQLAAALRSGVGGQGSDPSSLAALLRRGRGGRTI
jgi:phage terminase large subunit-like protein